MQVCEPSSSGFGSCNPSRHLPGQAAVTEPTCHLALCMSPGPGPMWKPKARSFGRKEASKQPTPKARKQTCPHLASRDRRRQTIANRLKSISCLPRTETNQRGNPNSTDAYMPGTEEGRSSSVSALAAGGTTPARPHGSTAKAAPVGFAPFFYTAQPTASAALWSPRPRHTKAKMAKIRPRPTRRLGALARKHDAGLL